MSATVEPTMALRDCTAFQIDILVILDRDGPQYGLGIKRRLGDRHGEVNHGRLYPNLDRLDRRGLIEKDRFARDNRTNEYALTEAGEAALEAYAAWVGGEQA